MNIGQHVLLEKLSEHNSGFLSTGYYLKGYLTASVTIGATIEVDRYERAAREPHERTPVKIMGQYESSPVVRLEDEGYSIIATTHNSRWRITKLP